MSSKNSDFYETDPGCIKLMKFLIERTKDAKSPMNINQLAKEFKKTSRQTIPCLYNRIRKLGERVADLDTIDKATKVKVIFALSVSIDEDYLNELRKDAYVEIDEKNRITKYKAKDGSLELEGDQSLSAKNKEVWKQRKSGSQEHSGDLSQGSTPKTPGSVKRSAVDVPNSSKRTKVKSEDSAPNDSARVPSRKPAPPNPETQLLRQPKLEGDQGAEEAPIFRREGAPRASGAPASNPTVNQVDNAYTSRIKLLEAMKCLIFPLDMPSLAPLQEKIEKKIRELSSNEKIANDEMIPAMDLLVAKITNYSVTNLSETVESISLTRESFLDMDYQFIENSQPMSKNDSLVKEFLCYLKAAIMNSKLEGLEGLLEKIRGRIKEPASKDKNIAVEKVASVLQDTLNNAGV